jgi:hypothetical protein
MHFQANMLQQHVGGALAVSMLHKLKHYAL